MHCAKPPLPGDQACPSPSRRRSGDGGRRRGGASLGPRREGAHGPRGPGWSRVPQAAGGPAARVLRGTRRGTRLEARAAYPSAGLSAHNLVLVYSDKALPASAARGWPCLRLRRRQAAPCGCAARGRKSDRPPHSVPEASPRRWDRAGARALPLSESSWLSCGGAFAGLRAGRPSAPAAAPSLRARARGRA